MRRARRSRASSTAGVRLAASAPAHGSKSRSSEAWPAQLLRRCRTYFSEGTTSALTADFSASIAMRSGFDIDVSDHGKSNRQGVKRLRQ